MERRSASDGHRRESHLRQRPVIDRLLGVGALRQVFSGVARVVINIEAVGDIPRPARRRLLEWRFDRPIYVAGDSVSLRDRSCAHAFASTS